MWRKKSVGVNNMDRYFEEKLPEAYSETFVIDANDKKQGMRFQIAAIIIAAVLKIGRAHV